MTPTCIARLILMARTAASLFFYASSLSLEYPAFSTFQFAPNGVCVNPNLFKCTNADGGESFFTMRNVPGTGDCMFLAVALATATSMGLGGNDALLNKISAETRSVVAQVLASPVGTLHIEKKRIVRARDLLTSAAAQEGLTKVEYLEKLQKPGRDGGLYGGGPELTALSNVLRRPISIYELKKAKHNMNSDSTTTTAVAAESMSTTNGASIEKDIVCNIQRVGVFGDIFKDPLLRIPGSAVLSGLQEGAYSWHLHILVMNTGEEKHACVLLPQTPKTKI